MMRLLDKFQDAQGNPMSLPWMTAVEKAERRAALKAIEDEEYGVRPAPVPFPQGETILALASTLDNREARTLRLFVKLKVDPTTADTNGVGSVSPKMGVVISALRERPHSMQELIAHLAQQCAFSARYARREAYRIVSLLTACNRVQRVGPLVELK